jgi:2-methylcitrate dehydratase PrpD
MDTSYLLAKHVAETEYEDLPPEVVEVTKWSIMDTIGVILAASTLGEHGVKEIIELVKEAGGKEESTLIGFGGKTVSWMAALANGSMTHQLDYDDVYDARLCHPGAATIPAACAIAEKQGNINGKKFITAVALGCDVNCRLGLPVWRGAEGYSFLHPSVLGKFGAVASAGKLLGLDRTQMVNAFGLVLHQANVSMECVQTPGSAFRALRDAFVAKAGVLSALMAEKGIPGDKNSLDGKHGLYNLCWRSDSNPSLVTADLGKRFEGVNVSFKPWPSCRGTHAFIDAVLTIVKKHRIQPEDIGEIKLVGGLWGKGIFEGEERRRPKASIDAKISLPFVIGVAVARGNVTLEDFLPQGIQNPAALEVAKKVTYVLDERCNRPGTEPVQAEIRAKDGKKYFAEVEFPYGHPKNPISKSDLIGKFRNCAIYSVTPLSDRKLNEIIEKLDSLEELKNVSEVIQLLG